MSRPADTAAARRIAAERHHQDGFREGARWQREQIGHCGTCNMTTPVPGSGEFAFCSIMQRDVPQNGYCHEYERRHVDSSAH